MRARFTKPSRCHRLVIRLVAAVGNLNPTSSPSQSRSNVFGERIPFRLDYSKQRRIDYIGRRSKLAKVYCVGRRLAMTPARSLPNPVKVN